MDSRLMMQKDLDFSMHKLIYEGINVLALLVQWLHAASQEEDMQGKKEVRWFASAQPDKTIPTFKLV